MFILKGKTGRNYSFEGPYSDISQIKNVPGMYAILFNSIVIKTGISKNIRKCLDEFIRNNKTVSSNSIFEFIVKYDCVNNKKELFDIEKEVRKYYNPPLNKLKTKSCSYFKKYGYTIILLFTVLIILSMLLIINCADTSVSVNKSDDLKNRRKIGEVLDSVRHLYYKDSIPQKPYFNNPLQRNDTINNLTHKELTDTSLIYSSLDSSHLTNRINKDSRQKKLNISHIIIGKDSNSISKSIKHIFSMDLIILRGFYLQLEFKKDKTIKPQKPYYPLF